MQIPQPRFSFPMLTKELLEQAQRRRTYMVRALQGVVLYLFVLVIAYDNFAKANWDYLQALGTGREMMEVLFSVTAWGIYLVMPAMTCGAIAGERERETWQLLLVTRLGKRSILLEKYLSRVIAMASFLVLAIPIMAVAYPMGGVTAGRITDAVWCLTLCILLVGATGICCSAWSRTMAGALISTYLLLVAWVMVPLFSVMLIYDNPGRYEDGYLHQLYEGLFPSVEEAVNIPWIMYWGLDGMGMSVWSYLGYSAPTLIQVGLLLALARWGISRPLETGGASLWKRLFRRMDGMFHALNQNSLTRGKKFFAERNDLPVEKPVAWRETSRALLSSPTQKVRLGVAAAAVLVFSFVLAVAADEEVYLYIVPTFLFGLSCVFLVVSGASLISRERSRQTLDVLLSTPLGGEELLRQKMAGIRRWHWWIVCAFGAVLGLLVFLNGVGSLGTMSGSREWVFLSAAMLLVYFPPLAIWMSVACGIAAKSQSRAVMTALGVVGGWGLLGWGTAVSEIWQGPSLGWGNNTLVGMILSGTGPLFLITAMLNSFFFNQYSPHEEQYLLSWIVLNGIGYLGVAWVVRRWCYRNIAQLLGRMEVTDSGQTEEENRSEERVPDEERVAV